MKPLAIRSILVATDFEKDAAAALRSARQLAELTDAELHVVHADSAGIRDRRVDEQVAALGASVGVDVEVSLLAGPPAAAITQEAVRTRADVIVLGHHRNREGAPGSTADRVVRTAKTSCLILPQPLALPLSSVLVPIDIRNGTGPLDVALTWASALRRRGSGDAGRTRVQVLYVHSNRPSDEEPMRMLLLDHVNETKRRLAHIALVDIEQDIVHNSDAGAAILRHSQAMDAGLIVLGTRGKRIDTDPLGSVSSVVASSATRPVLLVPPEVWRAGV